MEATTPFGSAQPELPPVAQFRRELLENLHDRVGTDLSFATPSEAYLALAYTVRDRLIQRWLDTLHAGIDSQSRFVCYLSAEYLIGRQLDNNLLNTGTEDVAREALSDLGLSLDELRGLESEPGLGNGGLGRLAACYLDSLATLRIPSIGYGLRYEFGIFRQVFRDGWQVEEADDWLRRGNPWEFPHPEMAIEVGFGGGTESFIDPNGRFRVRWHPDRTLVGVPYNTMVPGYESGAVNTLRLWRAQATRSFDLDVFNAGDYLRAVHRNILSENLTKVLYPEDSTPQGRQLRLEQQYFFVACSLKDALRIVRVMGLPIEALPEKVVFQLNDTHPSIAIVELMRLLLDEYGMAWDPAWAVTTQVFAYTCHTLLPEALETWPVALIQSVLPRHMELIYEINRRFLESVRAQNPDDLGRLARMSLIAEGPEQRVRMANLAVVGSYAVNGVAELHSRLLREQTLRDFAELWPEKFQNKTNGVTPRRFMQLANPRLADLISSRIGPEWLTQMDDLRDLESLAESPEFRAEWRRIKQRNKQLLALIIRDRTGVTVDPASLFDVMVKRLHEYKRQHLKLLHIITLYNRIKADPAASVVPRTVIFGAKAAPGYRMAKLIVKLINDVAAVVNNDPDVAGRLKVVFLPNFNVSLGERVYPAADLSEQISLAGKEASGTGNMKLALNGALTIGTLDGANIEIRQLVGDENFFLFGLTAEEVAEHKARGYRPRDYVTADRELSLALDQIASGHFSDGDAGLFRPIVDNLLNDDPFMLLADFRSYIETQERAEHAYRDADHWSRMSILNVARCGYFSSDRSIREYCEEIWRVTPIDVPGNSGEDIDASQRLGQPSAEEQTSLPELPDDERDLLCDLAMLVGLDVMHATHSGAQGTLIELATAVAAPTAVARFLTRSALVRSLVPSDVEAIERSERLIGRLRKSYDLRSRDGRAALHDDVLVQCRAAMDLLTTRAKPQDAAEFARWLLLVGERVAEASVEPQPGRPERQVSESEVAALRELAAALRVEG
ncbi:MAG: glycogen/starch/alpha-glucan phosphorylase [Chloroflexi bacterium]|nr:glycogen/starch/alpha-glucan phosphorylase [Chloroflexota bacterium]